MPRPAETSFWEFPGFLFRVKPDFKGFADHLLFSAFTNPPVLAAEVNEPQTQRLQSKAARANNNLTVLFKGLLFHQKYYPLRKQELLSCLKWTAFSHIKPSFIEEIASAYVAARLAYLAQANPSTVNTRSVLTDLVDEWISFLNNPEVNTRAPRAQITREFASRSAEWRSLILDGKLINAGQAAPVQQQAKPGSFTRINPKGFFDDSSTDSSDSDSSDDHPVPFIKSEPRGNDEESNTPENPVGSSTVKFLAVNNTRRQQKRKAPSKLEQASVKRRRADYGSSFPFDTSDEESESESESDPAADIKGALADVKDLAENRHTRQLAKLRKMKSRYSKQKKQVAELQEQMTKITNAQPTQASLSVTAKGNANSLKCLTKDLEHQRKTVEKVEARIEELEARKAGEPDATIRNVMDTVQARVKAEVKSTWTGAAMELSNTKRELFKAMEDKGRQTSGQNERLDSLESRIMEQTSVTDRHEKLILDHEDVSVQQAIRATTMESSVTSRLDQQENRLASVEMHLAGQRHHHQAPSRTPTTPRRWLSEHSQVDGASELRGIIASQGEALRIQGKQLGEMSKELSSLRELSNNLAEEMKQVCSKPEIPGFNDLTKEVARLAEIRKLLPTMLGPQFSGEEPDAPSGAVSQPKDTKPTTLEDVTEEIANFRRMRTIFSPVLSRQFLEDALEN